MSGSICVIIGHEVRDLKYDVSVCVCIYIDVAFVVPLRRNALTTYLLLVFLNLHQKENNTLTHHHQTTTSTSPVPPSNIS